MAEDSKDSTSIKVASEDKLLCPDANPIKYATGVPGEYTLEPHDKKYLEVTLRKGNHSELVKKILRQRLEQRASEFPRWPASEVGGVRIMWLEGPFAYDRARLCNNFTDEDRRYRMKYLKSLELHHDEPVHVPEYERELINPLRRFYMKPMDWVENNIIRKYIIAHPVESAAVRSHISKTFLGWLVLMGLYYNIKYNYNTWESPYNIKLATSCDIAFPGDPRYPIKDWKTPQDHADFSFSKRKVFLDVNKIDLTPN